MDDKPREKIVFADYVRAIKKCVSVLILIAWFLFNFQSWLPTGKLHPCRLSSLQVCSFLYIYVNVCVCACVRVCLACVKEFSGGITIVIS